MDTQAASAQADRKVDPVYLIFTGEVLLDAPRNVAWARVINYPSWQSYSIVRNVSGEPGQEGEVVFLKKEELNFPPYYARTISVEPPNRVVWKVWLEPGGEIDTFGIVDFVLHDANEKTRFCYNCLYEFLVPHSTESELQEFREHKYNEYNAGLSANWAKLKEMVGNSRNRHSD